MDPTSYRRTESVIIHLLIHRNCHSARSPIHDHHDLSTYYPTYESYSPTYTPTPHKHNYPFIHIYLSTHISPIHLSTNTSIYPPTYLQSIHQPSHLSNPLYPYITHPQSMQSHDKTLCNNRPTWQKRFAMSSAFITIATWGLPHHLN